MAVKLQNKPNVEAPSGSFSNGNIKDNTGSNDGTPVNKAVYADIHQFFAQLLSIAEGEGFFITNGLPESDDDDYQYPAALNIISRLANKNIFKYLSESVIGESYDNTKPYAMKGLTDNGSSIASGYIYFNGTLFTCGGLNYGTVINDLQFNNIAENVLLITDSATPGLFQYSDLIFLTSITQVPYTDWVNHSIVAITPINPVDPDGGTLTSIGAGSYFRYKIIGKTLHFQFYLYLTFSGGPVTEIRVDLSNIFLTSLSVNGQFYGLAPRTNGNYGQFFSAKVLANSGVFHFYPSSGSLVAGTYEFGLNGVINIQ